MSLSDKVQHKAGVELSGGPFVKSYILEKDVKEFIRDLKKGLKVHERINPFIVAKIDKLAGKELSNG